MSYLISVKDNKDLSYVEDTYILEYLRSELNKTKSMIDSHVDEWDRIKKKIHDHEYIYYSSYRKKIYRQFHP